MSESMSIKTFDAGALAKLTEWTAKRDVLLAKAAAVSQVNDAAALEVSGAVQAAISKHRKALEAERMALTRKLDAVKKEIMAQEAEMAGGLDAELDRLKRLNNAYATEQAEAARRAEEQRLAEERARAEEQFAADQKAAEARAVFGAAAPVQAAPVAPVLPSVPAVAAPKASANSIRMVVKFDIVDSAQVPREFLAVNESAIRQFIEFKKKCGVSPRDLVIAGVRIWEEADVRAK